MLISRVWRIDEVALTDYITSASVAQEDVTFAFSSNHLGNSFHNVQHTKKIGFLFESTGQAC
jgi:hypothetical protein